MKISFFISGHSLIGVPLAQKRLAKAFFRRGYQVDFLIGYIPDDLELPMVDGWLFK